MLQKHILFKHSSFASLSPQTREAYHLLRQLLSLKYKFPLPMRNKYVHNIKESFSVVTLFGTEQEQLQLLSNVSRHDLALLRKFTELPEEAYRLFDKRLYAPDLYEQKSTENAETSTTTPPHKNSNKEE
ncbi:hypothetical protein FDP41_004944 [Naegleria fowleri]|uniref:Uncharacterized protein n=1 Tax=Naegleria fowleri TaxID=5763 RepID=A0A6A5BTM1_NAEFO|nr:uncharacterized protein FDP41_004944 [Naegleria fowleri]KAF0976269.1 hypothetical protein FDP41_004944 [Naegleria fowleri]CAG4716454.1 unnamed protein product [Naegleria fowleri]